MELQKVSLKILSDAPVTLNLDPFLQIFGRWRVQDWVDLADYAHMTRGPGIVLIGHRANFSFDLGTSAPGILYLSKKDLEGTAADRLRTVFRDCFALTERLLAEPEFPAQVHLRTGSLELAFNDRLETPHTEATDRALRPAVGAILDQIYGAGSYRLTAEPDPSRRYGFTIEAQGSPTDLLSTLVLR
jgi:hypothetical protein